MSTLRDLQEQRLGAAISRYVGYTTGAYDLDRIAAVADTLKEKPFRYEIEVLQQIRIRAQQSGKRQPSEDYARGIIDFAVGLGFLQRIAVDGTHSRLVITDLGRALHAANCIHNEDFYRFSLSFALLEYDADVYGLVLDFIERHGVNDWLREFREAIAELRRDRYNWLKEVLRADVLIRRVAQHVRWLDVKPRSIEIAKVGSDFVRHHTTPRRGWARLLGHIDEQDGLSSAGRVLVEKLRAGRSKYFWIGPDEETLRGLRIDIDTVPRPLGPAWSLLRPSGDTKSAPTSLIEEVGEFMIKVYPAIRMHRTNQASILAIIPFLYYRETTLGYRTDEDEILSRVFATFGETIAPLSGKGRKFGHYQLRAKV